MVVLSCGLAQSEANVVVQVLERMRGGATMNKAALACGMRQSTVHARFRKHPELWERVRHGDEDDDGEDDVCEGLSRGRGRPLDLPRDVDNALANEVERAIAEQHAPTGYAVLQQLVRKVWVSRMREARSVC